MLAATAALVATGLWWWKDRQFVGYTAIKGSQNWLLQAWIFYAGLGSGSLLGDVSVGERTTLQRSGIPWEGCSPALHGGMDGQPLAKIPLVRFGVYSSHTFPAESGKRRTYDSIPLKP